MNNLILVRHGQSQWNKEKRFTGWADVELTAKGINEAKNAGHIHSCIVSGISLCKSVLISKVPTTLAITIIAIKNNTEPPNVYKKNLNAAYTLLGPPQIPIIKNIGISPPSKNK